MAVIGSATVTLTQYRDIQSVTRYYKLQIVGSSAPLKPETKPPSSDWTDSEPACDISKELYFCDLTIFSNGEWEYSKVSKSTSYEAAKEAYNKAHNAQSSIDNLEIGGRNLLIGSKDGTISNQLLYGSTAVKYNDVILDGNPLYYMSGPRYIKINFPALKVGEQYTFSCDVARQSGGSSQDVFISIGESTAKVGIATGGIWTNFNVTFTASDASTYALVRVYTASSSGSGDYIAHTRHFKLEKGNKATDWTPAPEDVDAGIDNAQTAADSAASAAANAQTTADTAKTNAATAQSTADTAKANAATAQNTASQAQTKAQQALEASSVTAETLKAESARINNLESTKADITSLNAGIARIDTLEAGKADIDLANVNNAWITNGVIKDASIANEKVISVSANKLTAGTIDASKITVTNLNADNITVGTINGARIGNNSIDLNKLSQEVPTKEYLDSVEQKLQGEIDGAIETFTVSEIPTLNNEPAVNWTTNDIKSTHVGDLCYVVNNASDNDGFCYRFQYNGTVYSWALIKDNDVTKAIQDIAELDGKVTQFKTDYTSKVSEIDGGIESLKSRTTTIETTYSTKTYTDNKASDALTSANSYADTKASSALTDAKSYTDSTASSTLGEAKSYTDTATADMATTGDIPTKVSELTNDSSFATTTQVSTAKSEAISTASADATSKANSALDSAKSYTDSIEIGGRNLFANSLQTSNYLYSDANYISINLSGWGVSQTLVTNVDWNAHVINEVVLSMYLKPTTIDGGGSICAGFQIFYTDGTSTQYLGGIDWASNNTGYVVGEEGYCKLKCAIPEGKTVDYIIVAIRNSISTQTATVEYREIKLEAGNKATSWTPAPEDVIAGIVKAQTTATNAQTSADNAQTTANTAKTNAATAQSTADTAKANAATAQSTADTAKSNAANAQKTADTAKSNAANAQKTADTAKSNAAAAQTAASNAQTTANEAKAKAEAAQTAVSTKVETSVFNTLKNTVDENSVNITSLTETVTTKADSSTVTTLSNTVNKVKQTADANSSSISNLTTTVNSKADGSKVTALENKTSTIEQNLSGVTTRVTNLESENDGLDTRLTTAESKITADAIVSTVTSSKTYKDALSGKVDTSVYNTKMQQLDDSISLKATATDVYTKTQADSALATAKSQAISSAKSYTDTATTDMATKEYVTSQGYLTVTSDAITSKVSKNEVISAINQTAESVSINAEKINLRGAVTFSSFDNSLQTTINNKAETSDLEGVRTVATNAAKVATNYMEYDSTNGLIVGNKTGGSFVGSRAQVLPDSFNILDTDGTKLASFGETTVIGDTDKANLYLTYNELYMEDKDNKVFFKVGDYRNSTGVATLTYTDTRSVNVSAGRVYVALSIPVKIESVISVVVEGTTISENNYRFSIIDDTLDGEVVDHTTSMWVEGLTYGEGDKVEVEVTYTTKSPYSYYVFGLPDKSLIPGRFSSSEGWCTRASGEYTHAEGRRSLASGYASHAEGSSYAYGYMSHAEGISTANGDYSHAEGNSTTGKNANFSHAEGNNTVASSESQHVSGAFNIIDNDGKYAFIIGNGSGFNSRSNAMTVDWNGVPTFYGMAGEIKMWAGDAIPDGWLLCDGSEVSKTEYPYLYSSIGDLWGTPNSSSNFKLPNLTGRVLVGYDSADTDTTETFGKVGATGGARGAWYHTHTIGSSGAHHHATQGRTEGSGTGANIFESYNGASKTRSVNVPRTGDNGAHTHSPGSSGSSGNKLAADKANMPPYAVVKYIICAF